MHDLADSSSAELPPARVDLREPWASTLLPDLIAHTRCRIDLGDERGNDGVAAARPELTIDDGGPFSLRLGLERTSDRLTLHGWLLRSDERIGHESVRCLLAHYALLADRGVATAIDGVARAPKNPAFFHATRRRADPA